MTIVIYLKECEKCGISAADVVVIVVAAAVDYADAV